MNAQLKPGVQDLNDIIEHLNVSETCWHSRPAEAGLQNSEGSCGLSALDGQNSGMMRGKGGGVAQVFQDRPHKEQEHNVGIAFGGMITLSACWFGSSIIYKFWWHEIE